MNKRDYFPLIFISLKLLSKVIQTWNDCIDMLSSTVLKALKKYVDYKRNAYLDFQRNSLFWCLLVNIRMHNQIFTWNINRQYPLIVLFVLLQIIYIYRSKRMMSSSWSCCYLNEHEELCPTNLYK